MSRTVYVISGPAGVGKSTTSQQLVQALSKSAYISGDAISHIPVNGRGEPWLCKVGRSTHPDSQASMETHGCTDG
ncbi:Mrp family chromosome partitioning ATPase [Paenibacillus sp. 4624]|uniref:hypothetical protein n=1 Tax=Paenibacillus sp. 4624 TaxID=3156453 RepID=UPI003D1CBAC7